MPVLAPPPFAPRAMPPAEGPVGGRRCPRCLEFWPLDPEFWYAKGGKSNSYHCYCRACCGDARNAHRARAGAAP